ncbi:hypothetical protein ABB37_04909 [Leptomonas pyrrhocoris]|uniref:SAP domain-containing protein n=1 Tax=Leptomonas pyrrhocoris TaxID=157538 RepID=A0A0N0DV32_LEPPY|nr:hypothetical protein ABB37_04909 [Leptomonas pyrrhocoris]KPA79812.1 hypothetical protein ABB37_04909 [Leptomonas pyrrhocoris]|eukprot:XP_015658251.1 hypothetical protein ABB37_04909 [Leptomonas pyrrhocoris]
MDLVKRRLVYVADENEVLLGDLSGTPPTRQSRTSLLMVPLSPPLSQRSSGTISPPPRPVFTQDAAPPQVDRKLLVSYDGFLLADGSGHFATPHNATEAALMRDALKICRAYLKQFLADQQEESDSSESFSTAASSSTYVEESAESEVDESSDDSSAAPRYRRAKAAAAIQPAGPAPSPSKMTVAELKELLRARGVPAVGNKASLVLRAKSLLEDERAASLLDCGTDEATVTPRPSSQATCSRDHTVRNSGASTASRVSTLASSLLASPTARISTEGRGLWGALVTAGSRLFRGTARGSLGFVHEPAAGQDEVPPAKRRRSA